MRGKGEGAVYRVPSDRSKPLKYWTGTIELPPLDGNRRRVTIRRKNKSELLTELEEKRKEFKRRGDLPTKDQTVEQWFEYWHREFVVKGTRPKNAAGNKSVIDNHIVKTIGTVKLSKVTPAHVRRVTNGMIDKELSSTYALNAHRIMSGSFEVALREGRIGTNPAKLTPAPRKAVAPQEALTLPEALHILEHVAVDPVDGARWATSLLTGARRGEVIGLEWDRVTDVLDLSWQLQRLKVTERDGKPIVPADYEYRHLTGGLYLTRPKSRAGWRIIPLVDPLRAVLQRHRDISDSNPWGLVFTRNGKPRDPDRDSAEWKHVLASAGIDKDVVLHGLRHTTVDLLFLAGVPEDIIMEIVGHSTRTVTRAYKSRANRERLTDAMTKFSALLTPPDGAHSETHAAIE